MYMLIRRNRGGMCRGLLATTARQQTSSSSSSTTSSRSAWGKIRKHSLTHYITHTRTHITLHTYMVHRHTHTNHMGTHPQYISQTYRLHGHTWTLNTPAQHTWILAHMDQHTHTHLDEDIRREKRPRKKITLALARRCVRAAVVRVTHIHSRFSPPWIFWRTRRSKEEEMERTMEMKKKSTPETLWWWGDVSCSSKLLGKN